MKFYRFIILCQAFLISFILFSGITFAIVDNVNLNDTLSNWAVKQRFLLEKEKSKYQQLLLNKSGWKRIPLSGKALQAGDSSKIILQIRNRLYEWNDIDYNNHSLVYDSALLKAVKKYQSRNGIMADGKIGNVTIRCINTSLVDIISKIQINIDRFSKLTTDTGRFALLINIPDFRIYFFVNGKVADEMKVIVGKLNHETIQFDGMVRSIVFNPYWVVPPGILKDEIWPAVNKDKNYLQKHHMEKYGKTVRQLPGSDNPLGKIKFLFPNKYNIYMHDTPAKYLFKENSRMFSHGCIRLEEARKLAWLILKMEPGWDEQKFEEKLSQSNEQIIDLYKPISVKIRYFTSWVDQNGVLQMRNDIYKLESSL